jgi:hypothetical protein
MGKSAIPRLGDFERQGLALEAVCDCGHRRTITARFLLKLYGPETRLYPFVLEKLAERLRCHACRKSRPTLTVGRIRA